MDWESSCPTSACLKAPALTGVPITRFLLESGFATDGDLALALERGADAGQLEYFEVLLSHSTRSDAVYSLLYRSANYGEGKILNLLLEAGVDANHNDGEAYRAAVERGFEDFLHDGNISLSRLLKLSVRPTMDAVQAACKANRIADAKLLLDRMVDSDLNAALIAMLWAKSVDVVTSLIARGADVLHNDSEAPPILGIAANDLCRKAYVDAIAPGAVLDGTCKAFVVIRAALEPKAKEDSSTLAAGKAPKRKKNSKRKQK
ncbi:hypothetical protein DFJ77DRAFT_508395 [Powellomyces hirtus]|nr:hypothetical protein DFJ77DRAFT_508395 [Powellomyces hirtus]